MKKRTAVAFLALALCLGVGMGAFAAANNETISALLNRDLKVTYNGQAQSFQDAAGNAVYPISYNDTTYLPVRALSSLMGLPISFDADSYSIVMGTSNQPPVAPASPAAMVDLKNSGGTEFSTIIRDAADLKITTAGGVQTFTTGVYWDVWNGSGSATMKRAILFEVGGYSEVTFSAWSDIDAKAIVYDQNGKAFQLFDIPANSVVTKTLKLDGNVTQLGFAADGPVSSIGSVKILDPTLR